MKFARIIATCLALTLLIVGCSNEKPLGPPTDDSADVARNPYLPDRPHFCIGDYVWYDTNGDGCQDDGEPAAAGVVVELYADCDAPANIASTVTDENGYYEFCELPVGDYIVQFVAPDGYVFCNQYAGCGPEMDSNAGPDGMTDCISLVDGSDWTIDAALCLPDEETYCIGDLVWYDTNGDGCQDLDEPGAEGVSVELYAGCVDGEMIATTMTDADGYYAFCELMPGDYVVRFWAPDGYEFCMQYAECGPELDSNAGPDGMTDCITLVDADDWTIDAALCMPPPQDGCTLTIGYWKNHSGFGNGNQADMVTPLLPIWLGDADGMKSLDVDTAWMAFELLSQKVYGDPENGITKLYAQLLAAKLNVANGASDMDVADAIMEADAFLADHDWTDWESLTQEEQQMVIDWKDLFDYYNNGDIGPGHCD